MAYQYGLAGRRIRQTWPDAFYVTNTWDLGNQMTATLQGGSTQIVGYSYDNQGRRTGITRGSGVRSAYAYDGISRLTSLSHDPGRLGGRREVHLRLLRDPLKLLQE